MANTFSFNVDLLDDLARRKVVLFIGAGASKSARPRGGGSFKDWAEFLTDANLEVQDLKIQKIIKTRIICKDYLIASELLKINLGSGKLPLNFSKQRRPLGCIKH